MPLRIVLATRNAHKLEEIRAMLTDREAIVESLAAWPDAPEVIEDGATFEANAIKKAAAIAAYTGRRALADDSGLEVDALHGAPGVVSARYAGESRDDAANNRKLLDALAGVTARTARFRCVMALADPDGRIVTVEGRCEGRIAAAPRGNNGFGYDPLFVPDGASQTFGELPAADKNLISHRARALAALRSALTPPAALT